MSEDEDYGDPYWSTDEGQKALANHPRCWLPAGKFMCEMGGFDFPDECPVCGGAIPGETYH
jgi:hypothetical protein